MSFNKHLSLITLVSAALMVSFFPTTSSARKVSFSYNKSGKIRLIKSYLTDTGNAGRAQNIGTRVNQGQKIHFYYKIGPIRVIKGKGTPYKTRLVIKRDGRQIKDFGWKNANAVSKSQSRKTKTYGWFHTARWNLTLSGNARPGRYTAEISHRDLNTRKTVIIRYNFTVVAGNSRNSSQDYERGDNIQKFIMYAKRRDTSRLSSFFANRGGIFVDQYGFRDLKRDIESGAPISRRGRTMVTVGTATVHFSKLGKTMKITQVNCKGCGGGGN